MFIGGLPSGTGDLMVVADAPSTRLTDKQTSVYCGLLSGTGDLMVVADALSTRLTDKRTSVYCGLPSGTGGLDGGGRGPQHQTNRLVFIVAYRRGRGTCWWRPRPSAPD